MQWPEPVIDWFLQILLGTKIAFRSQNRCMAQEKLNLFKLSTVGVAQLGASATQIVRRNVLKAQTLCAFANDIQTTFSEIPRPQHEPCRLTARNIRPCFSSAVASHWSTESFTHAGIGTVRTWPPFPIRSTIAQCP